jgi:hypothetical protein
VIQHLDDTQGCGSLADAGRSIGARDARTGADIGTARRVSRTHCAVGGRRAVDAIEASLERHPNVRFHFTPTSASWLDQVEIWFSILQGKSLAGASFTSIKQLRQHIDDFIQAYNADTKSFKWTKTEVHQRSIKGRRISQL